MNRRVYSLLTLSTLAQLGCDLDPDPAPDAHEAVLAPETAAPATLDTLADASLARRTFTRDAAGGFVAADSDNIRVDADGLKVRLGEGDLRFTLMSWGRSGARRAAEPAEPVLGRCIAEATSRGADCARRVEQPHGSLTAWVARRPQGLQQGWTLAERPQGDGLVELHLAVAGGEVVEVEPEAAVLATKNVRWRYSDLKAWDADGKTLPAHLERSPQGLAVVVDDADARYPIEIDPTIVATEVKLVPPADSMGAYDDGSRYNYSASIRDVGDLNGDGYDDIAVGAPTDHTYDPFTDDYCRSNGRVYVYFGGPLGIDPNSMKILDPRADGVWKSASENPSPGVPYTWPEPDQCNLRFGMDITRDWGGYFGPPGGLLIGAPGSEIGPESQWNINWDHGSVWYYNTWGGPEFIGENILPAWDIGINPNDDIGWSVDAGDGMFTLSGTDYGHENYVIIGGAIYDPWLNSYEGLGHRLRFLGSQNRIARGAHLFGKDDAGAVVVNGSGEGDDWEYPKVLENPEPIQVDPHIPLHFGWDLDAAGDVDGDGHHDLIVGAPWNNGTGTAYFYSITSVKLLESDDYVKLIPPGLNTGDQLGAVAGVGDLNLDGFDDLLLGAPGVDNGELDAGLAYVVFGGPNGPDANAAIPLAPSDVMENAGFGHRVSPAGDVNGDSMPDLMVAACDKMEADEWGEYCRGAVYVFTTPSPTPPSPGKPNDKKWWVEE